MNFWPIDYNLIDLVAGANMKQYGNANFSNDRFQNVDSAISFNGGSYSVPPGVYFNSDFTVTLWGNVDINQFDKWLRILCFTNWVDNIVDHWMDTICLDFGKNQVSYFIIMKDKIYSDIHSNQPFNINIWNHFAFTLNGNTGSIYINGLRVSSGHLNVPNNVVRYVTTFGSIATFPCYAKIDFIKFYYRSLSSTEIQTESNQIFQKIYN